MHPIVPECHEGGQVHLLSRDFHVQSARAALEANGYVLLPGLTNWLDELSPLIKQDAWQALRNPNIAEVLHSHPDQRRLLFLNDTGQVDDEPQLTVAFVAKPEKSHLTVVEGFQSISTCPLLPSALTDYLQACARFIAHVRHYLLDILPSPILPTILKLRIFNYHSSDPLIGMRPFLVPPHAMRPHIDGSIVTLVISRSDGLLRFQHFGRWHCAVRLDNEPFALLIPGIAANHDLQLVPTPHMVLPSLEPRISVTIFLTPALQSNRLKAEAQLRKWRLAPTLEF